MEGLVVGFSFGFGLVCRSHQWQSANVSSFSMINYRCEYAVDKVKAGRSKGNGKNNN